MNQMTNELGALLRRDLTVFIEKSFCELNPETVFVLNWHIEAIADKLEQCRNGEISRLIINIPPRSLKSHCVSVAFAAWLLGHNPSEQIICASYGQDLADKHALDCRSTMASAWYQEVFPTRLSPRRQAVNEFMTTRGGVRLATSVGGVLTGRGARFIIIDDPLKPDEAVSDSRRQSVNDWYDNTLCSRLNDKRTGCIILIMQRLHEDDLTGHVQKSGNWETLRLPAIAEEDEEHVIVSPYGVRTVRRSAGEALDPQREPLEILEPIRANLGEYNFAGQYQQAPSPQGGGVVKIDWFPRYSPQTLPRDFDFIFQSWDTANKNTELSDYSVCTTWGVSKRRLYLLNVSRKRLVYPDLKRAVLNQRQTFGASVVVIEDKASGTQLIQELRNEGPYGVVGYQSKLDKIMRMHTVTSTIEAGLVYLSEQANWLEVLLHELATFPRSKYDDQVDSISQALDWIRQRDMTDSTLTITTVYI
jgi:predicted phage terminase large subunit-like protein